MQSNTPMTDALLLTCWKDIARYMGKGVRTVQRWEQTLDLPVRRPRGNAYKSAVVARTEDLDVWLASRWSCRDLREAQTPGVSQQVANIELSSAIKTSRQLRAENRALAHELSVALGMFVRSCAEMSREGMISASKQKESCSLPETLLAQAKIAKERGV